MKRRGDRRRLAKAALAGADGAMAPMYHPRRWAESDPERVAVRFAPSGAVIRYGELDRRANKAAHLMRSLGVGIGDHIAFLIGNEPAFFELAWAAHNAGVLFTPISWRFHPDEIAWIVADCGARVLFVGDAQRSLVEAASLDRAGLRLVQIGGGSLEQGWIDYEAALADLPATPLTDERRGADMVYSSGSTGRPKGIRQKLSDLPTDALSPLFAVFAERLGWDERSVYLTPAPLYHSGPLRFSMAMQHVGATLIVMEKFDAAAALDLIARHRVSHAHFVPTMMVRLLKLPQAARDAADMSSLAMVIHGAAPCPPDAKRAMIDWVGPILEESYGGSEGNGMTIISSAEWLDHPGSVGKPFVGRIAIVGEDGRDLPPHEPGLVYFDGGPAFEYHGNPGLTQTAHDGAGRSTLGDIGYLDADGYLYLTDRKHHMIVTGGVNVFPQEIENALIAHPDVLDVAVFGVPDADLGERIHAVIQPCVIPVAGNRLRDELLALCRARLAGYKTPRGIDFVAALPRHDTGKIYTRLLKERYAASTR